MPANSWSYYRNVQLSNYQICSMLRLQGSAIPAILVNPTLIGLDFFSDFEAIRKFEICKVFYISYFKFFS